MHIVANPLAAGALAVCALAGLAGCASRPPPSTVMPPIAAPAFDGVYAGAVRLSAVAAGDNENWCQTTGPVTLNVVSNRFALTLPHPNVPGNPTLAFEVDVAPDGSFSNPSQDGTASFTGQVAGRHLQGVVNGAGCQYAVDAEKT